MPVMLRLALPVLVTATVCAIALDVQGGAECEVSGDSVKVGTTIVPLSATDFEVAGVLTFTFSTAAFDRGLAVVGLKVTFTVHQSPGASVFGNGPQVLSGRTGLVQTAEGDACDPQVGRSELVTVTVCASLWTFKGELNARVSGDSVRTGKAVATNVA